jgi:hypothetical protein
MQPSITTHGRIVAIAGTAVLATASLTGLANAADPSAQYITPSTASTAPVVTQDRLTPTAMTANTAATAHLTVHSGACFTAKTLGVGVRDSAGNNLDFPGSASGARICPTGLSITTGSRKLPAGTYTEFGFWQDNAGTWHNLTTGTLKVSSSPAGPSPAPTATPSPTPTSTSTSTSTSTPSSAPSSAPTPTTTTTPTPTPTPAPVSPIAGQSLLWSDEFSSPIAWGSRWVGDSTSAFQYGNHNPGDNKLDWLSDSAVSVANGVATFTATPSSHTLENGKQAWTTGMLTTEGSTEGFQVKTGDYAETRVKLPTGSGAWPALWTWKNGNGEIDSFEYHPDNPNLLELTNHVKSGSDYYTNANSVGASEWVTIGTYYGANSVDWYVDGTKVYSDGTGVGTGWSAYLILNLSLSAGQYHPAPSGTAPISFAADYVRVYG